MTRTIIVLFITALLGGCVILPLGDYRDGGRGYRHYSDVYRYDNTYPYGDDGRDRDYRRWNRRDPDWRYRR